MSIFGKPLVKVTEKDLKKLIANKVPESVHLDYKAKAYGDTDEEIKEFLKDVSAFANAQGGLLLIGIKEENSMPVEIIGIDNADEESRRIIQLCESSIQERIQRLNTHIIPLENGRAVLAVEVPPSIGKPHMVSHNGHPYFWKRQGTINAPMNLEDIKCLIIQGNKGIQKIKRVFNERTDAIVDSFNPGVTFHFNIAPHYMWDDLINCDDNIVDLFDSYPRKHTRNNTPAVFSATHRQPFRDGVEAIQIGHKKSRLSQNYSSYNEKEVRIFNTGLLEFVWRQYDSIVGNPPLYFVHSPQLFVSLENFLLFAREVYSVANIGGPFAMGVGFYCVSNKLSLFYNRIDQWSPENIHELPESKIIPPLVKNFTLDNVSEVLRKCLDKIWRTFNFDRCPYFDENGTLNPPG